MRISTISSTVLGILLAAVTPAQAANTLYLPLVASGQEAEKPTHFRIVSTRLWSPGENGRSPGSADPCGDKHVLQVHLFDSCGDCGSAHRLNGVDVQAVHKAEEGGQSTEVIETGSAGMDAGLAQFSLQRSAQVSIISGVDGETVSSDSTIVSTVAHEIPNSQLIAAGYCSDVASCEQFVNQDSCRGRFSWNVVFKEVKP